MFVCHTGSLAYWLYRLLVKKRKHENNFTSYLTLSDDMLIFEV